MCGLAGFISKTDGGANVLDGMLGSISWRGPDDRGTWSDGDVYLGHNRLSILDLSASGKQPMLSASGRFVIAYNGEVYNYNELKSLFPVSFQWRGSSDTEVILECIERFGIIEAVKQFSGIFAFAVWDRKEHKLFLVRDHIGVKPLYYGFTKSAFLFSSQIRAFTKFPGFDRKISKQAMGLFFRYNTIPSPYAIYENTHKVKPGTIVEVQQGKVVAEHEYWSMAYCVERGAQSTFTCKAEAMESVESFIKNSVKQQLVADVPVGAFLSGGIDSSLVSYFAKAFKPDLKTFSIGFKEKRYDESDYARAVANLLQTDHIERILSPEEALSIIPNIPEFGDEPLNDASQIPTYFVSKLAREHVTVVVTGDGGDELFAGYSRYLRFLNIRSIQKYIPGFVLRALSTFNKLPSALRGMCGQKLAMKLFCVEEYFKHKSIEDQYDLISNFWPEICMDAPSLIRPEKAFLAQSDLSYMCYHDCKIYLPDVILTKVDRSSMYTSLESRVPLLDHGLYELSCRIPDSWKLNGLTTKYILKQILYKHVPQAMVDRPKMGFGLPIDIWLRGELKDWAMSLLADIKTDGVLPFDVIERRMSQHQKSQINWQYALWGVLVWQQWKNYYCARY
ncbi:MAG: asparagine synthase (glutamine-hydrolyzing) [Holosporales bacterium]|jgi:asparagine synthase (glutamine-hydrolysing)|nr:asparagine synthase (glutamine-hydrolyzing) [Holosporales bacterium]